MPRAINIRVVLLAFLALALCAPALSGAQLPPPPDPPIPPLPTPPSPPSAEVLAKLDPLVRLRLSLSGSSRVIVRATSAASVAPTAALIQQLGGTLGRDLPILEAQVAELPNTALQTLAESADVQRIALDRLILGAVERTSATVGATFARQTFGYNGLGVGVALVDSGVTAWHDDLSEGATLSSQRVSHFVDFVLNQTTPYDDNGHGTHVAGVIAGNGFDSGGARSGIAPGAHLVVLKVLDQQGHGHISNVIAALDYVVSHKDAFNIRVVNLSVGAGVYESYNSDLLTLAAKRAVDQGLVVVAAAGNVGRTSSNQIIYGGITSPGIAPWVLTVGASSHMGTVDRADDIVAPFSSRGPTGIDRLAKPDLVAPGVGIESLSNPNSWYYTNRSQYLLNGTVSAPSHPYLSLSGTSQAAPVVSGTIALMLQANPFLTPNAVKAILEYTAQTSPASDRLTQGAGFLNARGAIELAQFFASPSAGPYPATAEWGRQVLWGTHRVHGGRLMPDGNAWAGYLNWGAETIDGQNVRWGVICPLGADCETLPAAWASWGTTCSDPSCTAAVWNAENSLNAVWGSICGGADCQAAWASSGDDTVVWGNSGDDTVVWGNSGDDTVVWGNTDDDTVVWGNSCSASGCEPVIWPQ